MAYEVIEKTEESFSNFSGWYNATTIRVPVFCKLTEGREVFLMNRLVGVVETEKQNDSYLVRDIEGEKNEISAFVAQLKENGGKWYDRYINWPWHNEETKNLSPLEFIDWVESKGYTFDETMTCIEKDSGRIVFSGNLNELSCAFRYEIIDSSIADEIERHINLK